VIITVYGPGCAKCKKLEEIARKAIEQAGVKAELTKVEEIGEMAKAGVFLTPALVINDRVVISGKVPTVAEVVGHINAGAA